MLPDRQDAINHILDRLATAPTDRGVSTVLWNVALRYDAMTDTEYTAHREATWAAERYRRFGT